MEHLRVKEHNAARLDTKPIDFNRIWAEISNGLLMVLSDFVGTLGE